MRILDIHTHHLPPQACRAIVNVEPVSFSPRQGYYYSVGLHPWHLPEDGTTIDWEAFEEIVCHPQVLAIGEAGLDKMTGAPYALQEDVFRRQIDIASSLRKPLIIHCVRSYNEVMAIRKSTKAETPWIIHGFRGKKELACQLTGQGIYLSFGFRFQEGSLCATSLDMMFLETDDSPADIQTLYDLVACRRSLTVNSLTKRIQENIGRVFFQD